MKKILFALFALVISSVSVNAQEHGTAEEAKAMVEKAVAYINENGEDAAFAEIQKADGEFRSKDLYVFVWDYKDGMMKAHGANPAMVGKPFMDMKDADGVLFFHEFKKTAEGAGDGWVDYKWPNPNTKKIEQKSSYIKKLNDNLLVGCGIYK